MDKKTQDKITKIIEGELPTNCTPYDDEYKLCFINEIAKVSRHIYTYGYY